jgi:hypothetical protein
VQALAGRDVIVLQDNDAAGRKKALKAATVLHGVTKTVRIVSLPSLTEGEDVSDWLDLSRWNTSDKLIELSFSTPPWTPSQSTTAPAESTPDPPPAAAPKPQWPTPWTWLRRLPLARMRATSTPVPTRLSSRDAF